MAMDQCAAGPVTREFADAAMVTGTRTGPALKRTLQELHLNTSLLPTQP
jgi:hypothetical protein